MLESTFFGVVIISLLFTILTVADDEMAWPILAFVSWIIAAIMVVDLERPYVVSVGGVVTEYTYNYSGGIFLQLLFAGVALVLVAIFLMRVMEINKEAMEAKRPIGG